MGKPLIDKFFAALTHWLMKEHEPEGIPLTDFGRLSYEIKPCDVLLIEGQSRVSNVIRMVTQSPWTHAVLYIGRLHDIENPLLRARIKETYSGDDSDQLIIESLLGKGTIVSPLNRYAKMHIRICRPEGIARQDAQNVISYAIGRIGVQYDFRQILDLARLLFPWSFLPRRWRSSLFRYNAGESTRQICSSLLAEAFDSVHFPILPIIKQTEAERFELIQRNPRLFTPRDFDTSPFFGIIKYPIFELSHHAIYRHLPWAQDSTMYANDDGSIASTLKPPPVPVPEKEKISASSSETDGILNKTPEKVHAAKHWLFSREKKEKN